MVPPAAGPPTPDRHRRAPRPGRANRSRRPPPSAPDPRDPPGAPNPGRRGRRRPGYRHRPGEGRPGGGRARCARPPVDAEAQLLRLQDLLDGHLVLRVALHLAGAQADGEVTGLLGLGLHLQNEIGGGCAQAGPCRPLGEDPHRGGRLAGQRDGRAPGGVGRGVHHQRDVVLPVEGVLGDGVEPQAAAEEDGAEPEPPVRQEPAPHRQAQALRPFRPARRRRRRARLPPGRRSPPIRPLAADLLQGLLGRVPPRHEVAGEHGSRAPEAGAAVDRGGQSVTLGGVHEFQEAVDLLRARDGHVRHRQVQVAKPRRPGPRGLLREGDEGPHAGALQGTDVSLGQLARESEAGHPAGKDPSEVVDHPPPPRDPPPSTRRRARPPSSRWGPPP